MYQDVNSAVLEQSGYICHDQQDVLYRKFYFRSLFFECGHEGSESASVILNCIFFYFFYFANPQ